MLISFFTIHGNFTEMISEENGVMGNIVQPPMTEEAGKRFSVSRSQIKLLALVTMVIDHVGYMFFFVWNYPHLYYILRGIGRISFPLICFMLVQGMIHTHSKPKYMLRLIVFAVISEIPFDMAFSRRLINTQSQNVFFTLAIGLAAIWLFQKSEELISNGFQRVVAMLAVTAAASVCAYLLHTDYSYFGIWVILTFYIFRNNFASLAYVAGMLFAEHSMLELAGGMFALFPVYYYSPEKSDGKTVLPKWFFYVFYPLHLVILILIRQLIY